MTLTYLFTINITTTVDKSMPPVSFQRRHVIAVRLSGGQTPKAIANTLGLSVKTIYRLRRQFRQPDGTFLAVAASVATKQAFTREQLVEMSQWLEEEPKLTLNLELREKAVTEVL
jgi:transposase